MIPDDDRLAAICDGKADAEPWEARMMAAELLARRAGDSQTRILEAAQLQVIAASIVADAEGIESVGPDIAPEDLPPLDEHLRQIDRVADQLREAMKRGEGKPPK